MLVKIIIKTKTYNMALELNKDILLKFRADIANDIDIVAHQSVSGHYDLDKKNIVEVMLKNYYRLKDAEIVESMESQYSDNDELSSTDGSTDSPIILDISDLHEHEYVSDNNPEIIENDYDTHFIKPERKIVKNKTNTVNNYSDVLSDDSKETIVSSNKNSIVPNDIDDEFTLQTFPIMNKTNKTNKTDKTNEDRSFILYENDANKTQTVTATATALANANVNLKLTTSTLIEDNSYINNSYMPKYNPQLDEMDFIIGNGHDYNPFILKIEV
jgi:hypothetical protein